MGLRAGGWNKLRCPLHLTLGYLLTIGVASSFRWMTMAELIPETNPANTTAGGTPSEVVVFSQDWMDAYLSGEAGFCERAMDTYSWRPAGWGSNINCLIATWLSGALAGRKEIAINVGGDMFLQLNCLSRSKARELREFSPSREVSEAERKTAVTDVYRAQEVVQKEAKSALLEAGSDLDIVGASAALLNHLNSNIQPWLEEDIDSVLNEERIKQFRERKFVGLHVRRGDKLLHEATKVDTSVYLDKAASIARQSGLNDSALNAITGIWLSSDDSAVISEVQQLAPNRFPNVRPENVIWISDRVAVNPPHANVPGYDELPTTIRHMTYETIVGLFAELKMLSEAEVFVGTYSSNVARYVHLLRETNNFPRNTTASVDQPTWFPGRTLLRH